MPTAVKSIRLDKEQWAEFNSIAEKTGLKRNTIIRYILRRGTGQTAEAAMIAEELIALQERIQEKMVHVHHCLRELVLEPMVETAPKERHRIVRGRGTPRLRKSNAADSTVDAGE